MMKKFAQLLKGMENYKDGALLFVRLVLCFMFVYVHGGPKPLRGRKGNAHGYVPDRILIDRAFGHEASGQVGHQRRGPIRRPPANFGVHAAFEPVTGLGGQAQPLGRFPDAHRAEMRAFQKHLGGVVLDFGIEPAHDSGQGHLPLAIANHQVVPGQNPLGPVQGDEPVAGLGQLDHDAPLFEPVHVKGVQRLTDFHEHEIGDVDHVADGPDPGRGQAVHQPEGRRTDFHVLDHPRHVPGAVVGIDDGHRGQVLDARIRFPQIDGRKRERQLIDAGQFPGHAHHGQAVGPVGGDADFDDPVVQVQNTLDGLADGRVFRQNHDPGRVRAEHEFEFRTEHAGRGRATDFRFAHVLAAGQGGPHQGQGRHHVGLDVGRAADHLMNLVPGLDPADLQVIAFGMVLHFGHPGGDHGFQITVPVVEVFHLQADHGQPVGQRLGSGLQIHVITEPLITNTHDGTGRSELFEKAEIVIEERPKIVQAVFEHGHPFDAHAESKAGYRFGIVIHEFIDFGVDHAGTQDFQPAGVLAYPAPGPPADHAADVHLGAGLGEGEKAGPEPKRRVRRKKLVHEGSQHALEVAEGDALVHHQAFDLVEHGRVGHVRIPAVGLARHDDPDRRPLRFHGADLHGRGVGAEQHLFGHEQGVLHVPGRMVLGKVQGLEVVVIQLDLGAFGDVEAHAAEDGGDVLDGPGDQVPLAPDPSPAGQGHVQAQPRFRPGQQGLLTVFDRLGQILLDPVDQLAHFGPLGGGQFAHAPHQPGQAALGSQILDPDRFHIVRTPGGFQTVLGFPFEFEQFGLHRLRHRLIPLPVNNTSRLKNVLRPSLGVRLESESSKYVSYSSGSDSSSSLILGRNPIS